MPICPSCGAEYVEGTIVCADCQSSLVDQTGSPPPDVEIVEWERLLGVPNQVVGVLLRGVLEGADVPTRLEENAIPVYGAVPSSWSNDAWGELLVPKQHLTEARALVEEYLQRVSAELGPDEADVSDEE